MSSREDICNMALSHVGNSVEINNLDTEKSKEAQACRRFFENVRDEVLEDFDWPFARRRETLQLVAADPNLDWAYAYRRPSGALALRSIPNDSGVKPDTLATRVASELGSDDTGGLIYTDQVNAEITYTKQVTNTETFSANFVSMMSLLLASRIGPRVAGGDQFKLADRAYSIYTRAVQKAQANAANEDSRSEPQPDAEMIRIRGVGTSNSGADDSWP